MFDDQTAHFAKGLFAVSFAVHQDYMLIVAACADTVVKANGGVISAIPHGV